MSAKSIALRQGVYVFIGLAILTVIEFYMGLWEWGLAPLMLVALLKAALVVHFYMHVYRLWQEESH